MKSCKYRTEKLFNEIIMLHTFCQVRRKQLPASHLDIDGEDLFLLHIATLKSRAICAHSAGVTSGSRVHLDGALWDGAVVVRHIDLVGACRHREGTLMVTEAVDQMELLSILSIVHTQ